LRGAYARRLSGVPNSGGERFRARGGQGDAVSPAVNGRAGLSAPRQGRPTGTAVAIGAIRRRRPYLRASSSRPLIGTTIGAPSRSGPDLSRTPPPSAASSPPPRALQPSDRVLAEWRRVSPRTPALAIHHRTRRHIRQPVRRGLPRRRQRRRAPFRRHRPTRQPPFDRIWDARHTLHGDVHPVRRYRQQKRQIHVPNRGSDSVARDFGRQHERGQPGAAVGPFGLGVYPVITEIAHFYPSTVGGTVRVAMLAEQRYRGHAHPAASRASTRECSLTESSRSSAPDCCVRSRTRSWP